MGFHGKWKVSLDTLIKCRFYTQLYGSWKVLWRPPWHLAAYTSLNFFRWQALKRAYWVPCGLLSLQIGRSESPVNFFLFEVERCKAVASLTLSIWPRRHVEDVAAHLQLAEHATFYSLMACVKKLLPRRGWKSHIGKHAQARSWHADDVVQTPHVAFQLFFF